ncbi:MAG: mechanosensitive ion channel protein MscS, partial [Synechococcaceae bacterium WBB_3_034]|nr:mechanosensitive ion channel protein MscS [Synechococcaceae bacterium WBB_3_034]
LLLAIAGPGLTLAFSLLLPTHRHAHGLLQFLAALWLGWNLLQLLELLLRHWLPQERVHQLFSRLLRPLYLLVATLALINKLDSISDLAVIPVGQLFGTSIELGKVFGSLLVIYLLLLGSGPPAAAMAWLAHRFLGISEGSRKALELILRYSVVGVGIMAIAFHVGFNATALLAVAGGLSVGLGFGIKEVFSNFVSGLWLLFEGSVRPGEVLMIAAVIALLEATALSVPRVLKHPAPKGLLLNYGDSAINYALRFWIANPMDNVGICSEVNQAIWTAFKQHGIEIPFPQQVQHIAASPGDQPDANLRR